MRTKMMVAMTLMKIMKMKDDDKDDDGGDDAGEDNEDEG